MKLIFLYYYTKYNTSLVGRLIELNKKIIVFLIPRFDGRNARWQMQSLS